jgi:hypothetical protein
MKKIVKKGKSRKALPAVKKEKGKEEKQYVFSRSTRRKMSLAHTGKKLSEETKEKIRAAKAERKWMIEQGYLQPFRHSEETKKKLSRIMKRKKHKPTRRALRRSAEERANRKEDKKLQRKIIKGQL